MTSRAKFREYWNMKISGYDDHSSLANEPKEGIQIVYLLSINK